MIRIQNSVSLDRMHGKMLFAACMADRMWGQLKKEECRIVGADSGKSTMEFDVAGFTQHEKQEARRLVYAILGRNFDVILKEEDERLLVRFNGPY